MRHVFRNSLLTIAAASIEHCVFRAIYARNNAIVQTTALLLRGALNLGAVNEDNEGEDLTFLNDEEVADCTDINTKTVLRPWLAWTREIQVNPLYVNLV